jgi:hypothetical protein
MRVATTTALLLLMACGNHDETTTTTSASTTAATQTSAVTLTPEELGELGARIQKEPARADELLSQRGLTQQSFEKAIRDVTENADASKRYAAAFKKAGA